MALGSTPSEARRRRMTRPVLREGEKEGGKEGREDKISDIA